MSDNNAGNSKAGSSQMRGTVSDSEGSTTGPSSPASIASVISVAGSSLTDGPALENLNITEKRRNRSGCAKRKARRNKAKRDGSNPPGPSAATSTSPQEGSSRKRPLTPGETPPDAKQEPKRTKDSAGGLSYSAAVDSSLRMAIVLEGYPEALLNEAQAALIEEALWDCLCRHRRDKSAQPPRFLQTRLQLGALHVACADQFSRSWLEKITPTIKVIEGASLRVIERSALNKTKKVLVFIPGRTKPANEVLDMVAWQNPSLPVRQWIIHSRTEVPSKGQHLVLGMDDAAFKTLEAHQFTAFYGLARVSFKALGSRPEETPCNAPQK